MTEFSKPKSFPSFFTASAQALWNFTLRPVSMFRRWVSYFHSPFVRMAPRARFAAATLAIGALHAFGSGAGCDCEGDSNLREKPFEDTLCDGIDEPGSAFGDADEIKNCDFDRDGHCDANNKVVFLDPDGSGRFTVPPQTICPLTRNSRFVQKSGFGDDCNDQDAAIYGGNARDSQAAFQPHEEVCDNKDNNCDTRIDEDMPELDCGQGECRRVIPSCVNGLPQQCVSGQSHPKDLCDGKDEDCDGITDNQETATGFNCFPSNYPHPKGVGQCRAGIQRCVNGALEPCEGYGVASQELCDGVDSDCDGEREAIGEPCYTGPGGTKNVGLCKAGAWNCSSPTSPPICQGEVKPSQEICDNRDNDCDREVDNGHGRNAFVHLVDDSGSMYVIVNNVDYNYVMIFKDAVNSINANQPYINTPDSVFSAIDVGDYRRDNDPTLVSDLTSWNIFNAAVQSHFSNRSGAEEVVAEATAMALCSRLQLERQAAGQGSLPSDHFCAAKVFNNPDQRVSANAVLNLLHDRGERLNLVLYSDEGLPTDDSTDQAGNPASPLMRINQYDLVPLVQELKGYTDVDIVVFTKASNWNDEPRGYKTLAESASYYEHHWLDDGLSAQEVARILDDYYKRRHCGRLPIPN